MPNRHRGRPRKANARSRPTTRKGGAPPPDFGTLQLRRLKAILNPSKPGLPADPLAVLFGRDLITEAAYAVGRQFGALTSIARRGWQLQEGSVADLWRRMIAGTVGDIATPRTIGSANPADDDVPTTAGQMRRRLEHMRRELWRTDRRGELYFAAVGVCVDLAWPAWLKRIVTGHPGYPGDHRRFGQVKEGLHRLAELLRTNGAVRTCGDRLALRAAPGVRGPRVLN